MPLTSDCIAHHSLSATIDLFQDGIVGRGCASMDEDPQGPGNWMAVELGSNEACIGEWQPKVMLVSRGNKKRPNIDDIRCNCCKPQGERMVATILLPACQVGTCHKS